MIVKSTLSVRPFEVGKVETPSWITIDGKPVKPQPFYIAREASLEEYRAEWPADENLAGYRFYEVHTD